MKCMKCFLFFAVPILFLSPLRANEKVVDVAPLNAEIASANTAGDAWVKDPASIALHFVGPWLVPGGEMTSQRREVAASAAGEDPASGIAVIVKEDGLFDDATRRIDHRFVFALENGSWTVTDASVKYHDARPAFPLREEENTPKATAGIILLQQVPSPALAEAASTRGIEDLQSTTFAALEGDSAALNALLNLSLHVNGAAQQDYARLLFGLNCFFETPGFTRYLYFNLEEGASDAVTGLLRRVADGELP